MSVILYFIAIRISAYAMYVAENCNKLCSIYPVLHTLRDSIVGKLDGASLP